MPKDLFDRLHAAQGESDYRQQFLSLLVCKAGSSNRVRSYLDKGRICQIAITTVRWHFPGSAELAARKITGRRRSPSLSTCATAIASTFAPSSMPTGSSLPLPTPARKFAHSRCCHPKTTSRSTPVSPIGRPIRSAACAFHNFGGSPQWDCVRIGWKADKSGRMVRHANEPHTHSLGQNASTVARACYQVAGARWAPPSEKEVNLASSRANVRCGWKADIRLKVVNR